LNNWRITYISNLANFMSYNSTTHKPYGIAQR